MSGKFNIKQPGSTTSYPSKRQTPLSVSKKVRNQYIYPRGFNYYLFIHVLSSNKYINIFTFIFYIQDTMLKLKRCKFPEAMLLLTCKSPGGKKDGKGEEKDTDMEGGLPVGPEGTAASGASSHVSPHHPLNFPYFWCDHMVEYLD